MASDNPNVLLAKLLGVVLLAVGVLGFVPPLVIDGALLGIFGVNALHNIVHLGSGAVLLGAALAVDGSNARMANISLGAVYVLVALLGFAGVLVPDLLNTHADIVAHADNMLHLVVAVGLLGVGLGLATEDATATV